MALDRGTRFGPYEIVAPLGAGGMGEVYRARDPRLGRDVAIKVLPAAVSADADRLRRFEQEARATAALNHPNIIAVHDIGTHPSAGSGQAVPYIVSELLDGETLRQRLDEGGALQLRKAVDYAVQIARGLAAAHDNGIVHRDLKPENVFVTSDGHVKILDFGLAKLVDPEPALADVTQMATTPHATKSGVILGTIGYMAPEQVRGQTVDHRADIFALGAMLHEMLSGRRAFGGPTAADTLSAILDKNPAELPVSGQIPAALARIVDRCLEKNPAARFQSTRDLTFALEALDARSGATSVIAPAAAPRDRHRARWLLVAAAMAIAFLAAAAALYVRRGAEERVMTRLDVVTPQTSDSGAGFAISLDGRRLAFVAAVAGVPRLWIRSLDDATARPLAGSDGAQYPFWAPNGRALAFFAEGKLKRIDLTSGTTAPLANTASPRGGAWSTDDVILFAPGTTGGLSRVSATGGPVTAVTTLETGQVSHRFPVFLDKRQFLFLTTLGQAATRGIYVGSLDGGRPTRILETAEVAAVFAPPDRVLTLSQSVLTARRFDARNPTSLGEPVALADGFQISGTYGLPPFSASATGTLAYRTHVSVQRQLIWMDRTGKTLAEAAPRDSDGQSVITLAADDRSVASVRLLQSNVDVWVRDLGRHTLARFTFDPSIDASPLWSPNGDRITFYSNRGGTPDLFEKPIDGSVEEHLVLATDQPKAPLDWSADGRFLLFASQDPRTQCDIWALPMTGDRKPFPVVRTASDDVHARFSPDVHWIAYASNETGRYEVYVRPFPGPGARLQLSTAGGIYPVWRRDGKELYFIAPDNGMMSVAIDTTATATLRPGTPVALFPTNLATGGNVGISGSNSRAEYAVAADGRFLLNVRVGEAASPITIMQNWDVLLKRTTPH